MQRKNNCLARQGKKHLKPRWGNIFLLFICLSVCLAWGVNAWGETEGETYNPQPETVKIIVNEGDTLWCLIKQFNSDVALNMNKAIYETQIYNNLNSATIMVGQVLEIPLFMD